jgi:hypothetical protein
MILSRELDDLVDRAADSIQSVLVWADDPLERKAIAAAIHERSLRRTKPFVCVQCDGTEGFEVRVFGHEAGALTGSREALPGVLEIADGGACSMLLSLAGVFDSVLPPASGSTCAMCSAPARLFVSWSWAGASERTSFES